MSGATDRHEQLERLNDELDVVQDTLVDCLIAMGELDLGGESRRNLGWMMIWISDVHEQIYGQRPDLRPPPPERKWKNVEETGEWGLNPEFTAGREDELTRVYHQLQLVGDLLNDASFRMTALDMDAKANIRRVEDSLAMIGKIREEIRGNSPPELVNRPRWRRTAEGESGGDGERAPDRHEELGHLARELEVAFTLLGACAGMIRDVDLDPPANIRRIGEALGNITEIQFQIYKERPDLIPDDLKGTKIDPRAENEGDPGAGT